MDLAAWQEVELVEPNTRSDTSEAIWLQYVRSLDSQKYTVWEIKCQQCQLAMVVLRSQDQEMQLMEKHRFNSKLIVDKTLFLWRFLEWFLITLDLRFHLHTRSTKSEMVGLGGDIISESHSTVKYLQLVQLNL